MADFITDIAEGLAIPFGTPLNFYASPSSTPEQYELVMCIAESESYDDARTRLGKDYPRRDEMLQWLMFYGQQETGEVSEEGHKIVTLAKTRFASYPEVGGSSDDNVIVGDDVSSEIISMKYQLYGLIRQIENLMESSEDTAKSLRNIANLYGKKEEVLQELQIIKNILQEYYN